MKVRDSGMPEEGWWSTFFDPEKVLRTFGLDKQVQDVVEFGSGSSVKTRLLLALLLAGAGLLLRSFYRLQHVDPGYRGDHVLSAEAFGNFTKYPTADAQLGFYLPLIERLEQQPGVISAAVTNAVPLSGVAPGSAPFQIEGKSIAPLELSGPEVIALDGAEPLTLKWQPPSDRRASRIQVKVDISHHGGLKGVIECDVEDDGEALIEASLIDQLIALGTAGFPTINVNRVATGGVKIDPGTVSGPGGGWTSAPANKPTNVSNPRRVA